MIEDWSDSNKPIAEVEVSNDSTGVQKKSSTNEQDKDAQNDEIYPQERSNQHNFVEKNEVSNQTSNLGNYLAADAISRVRYLKELFNHLLMKVLEKKYKNLRLLYLSFRTG